MRRRRAAAEQRKRELRRRAPRQRWRHAAQLRERQGQCEASNRGRALLVQCMSSCSAISQYSELFCHYISLQSCKMQCAISLVIQQCSLCTQKCSACMHGSCRHWPPPCQLRRWASGPAAQQSGWGQSAATAMHCK